MYWPLGTPRVYAAAKHRRKPVDTKGEDDDEDDDDNDPRDETSTALLGLRVSRNGQLFATITASTLTVWQSSVGDM